MKINPFKKESQERAAYKARTGISDEMLDASEDVYLMVAIYDVKAKELVTQPALYKNEDVAMREFGVLVNNPGSMFNKHPHDFIMKKLATMHVRQGNIWAEEPIAICTSTDVYRPLSSQIEAENGRPQ